MARLASIWFVLTGMIPVAVGGISLPSLGSDMRVMDMRCEYLANPLGVDVLEPRLSWKLRSQWRGQRQTAYQVIVASNIDLLRENRGDLWNSGKILTDKSLDVVYAGAPLASRTTCYWKVRVWDRNNKPSPFSEIATWEMGLLDPNDWQAQWAVAPGSEAGSEGPAPYLRKTFVLSKWVKRARLYVCGLGYYELHLNGTRVDNHVLDPSFTRYNQRALYLSYDVTDRLRRGFNAMALVLGNGWYNLDSDQVPWQGQPTARCQLEVTFIDGSRRTVASDGTWRAAESPIIFNSICTGEAYDALEKVPGWDSADFYDVDWPIAQVGEGPKGTLEAQMLPSMEVAETLEPIALTEPQPGVYVFDIGRGISGWAQLRVSGPAGAEVTIQYGEELAEDGTVDEAKLAGTPQDDTYVLQGKGSEVWEPDFVYHRFRYVQVTGLPSPPSFDTIRGRVVHTAFDRVGHFECSNASLNAIQRDAVRSYLNRFQGWANDMCPAVEMGVYNFESASAYTKWVNDFDSIELPSTKVALELVLASWRLYEYCGDTRLLAEQYEAIQRYADYLGEQAEDIVSMGRYYHAAVIVSKIATLLGDTDAARRYTSLALSVRDEFNESFFDAATGFYVGKTPQAQARALYHGLVPPSAQQRVLENLVDMIETGDYDLNADTAGATDIIEALVDNNRSDVVYEMTTRAARASSDRLASEGEAVPCNLPPTEAAPYRETLSPWLYRTLAGINLSADTVGFKHFIIKPQLLGDVTWVRAEHESRYGAIQSNWNLYEDTFTLKVTVPTNTTATVYVPSDVDAFVNEGPGYIHSGDHVRFVGLKDGYVLFEVESGTFKFVSQVTR